VGPAGSLRRLAERTRADGRRFSAETASPASVEPAREYELKLTEDEAVLVHYALWLAFGSERRSRSLWQKLSDGLGDRFSAVSTASERME
jgi:hypothetical protein